MTKLMVLGFLIRNAMSGYEIQQIANHSGMENWANVLPGSIYHALKKLEQEGLIQIKAHEQVGNRSKAIYQITDKGKETYHQLLLQTASEVNVLFSSTFYTALLFLNDLPDEDARVAISTQQKRLEKSLEEFYHIRKQKERHLPPRGEATFAHMEAQLLSYQKLLQQVRDSLEQNS
ncbi:PadR family transcriptional regulator [Hazenella sp. IB182357]|uniref:PadR family transcriptional regulator n=1 Tax=Polycladospora coralii TaxID=2771432 RepID=A0A926RWI5_9BACL|nr:PadR family transcriptional regulator [Polycladospora coralii]MBD1371551.1 PadR family transcriptional regulator [Polycladospora coralii]MBS7529019.1 PadR family transcriptional regulator [Polycladospora coralii]